MARTRSARRQDERDESSPETSHNEHRSTRFRPQVAFTPYDLEFQATQSSPLESSIQTLNPESSPGPSTLPDIASRSSPGLGTLPDTAFSNFLTQLLPRINSQVNSQPKPQVSLTSKREALCEKLPSSIHQYPGAKKTEQSLIKYKTTSRQMIHEYGTYRWRNDIGKRKLADTYFPIFADLDPLINDLCCFQEWDKFFNLKLTRYSDDMTKCLFSNAWITNEGEGEGENIIFHTAVHMEELSFSGSSINNALGITDHGVVVNDTDEIPTDIYALLQLPYSEKFHPDPSDLPVKYKQLRYLIQRCVCGKTFGNGMSFIDWILLYHTIKKNKINFGKMMIYFLINCLRFRRKQLIHSPLLLFLVEKQMSVPLSVRDMKPKYINKSYVNKLLRGKRKSSEAQNEPMKFSRLEETVNSLKDKVLYLEDKVQYLEDDCQKKIERIEAGIEELLEFYRANR